VPETRVDSTSETLVPIVPVGRVSAVAGRSRDFVQSLEKGLAVIASFSRDRSIQTPGEVAEQVGISRSTARRILLTLGELGYAVRAQNGFKLTSKVLDLGYSFLPSLRVAEVAQEPLERLADQLGESASMSILAGSEIVYVARVPTRRIMTTALRVGSRLPAYPTAMGRVLLAGLDDAEVEEYLSVVEPKRLTPRTITDRATLGATIALVREEGFALVDQELELDVRSLAAPVVKSHGKVIAAVSVACHAIRVSIGELESEFLPRVRDTALEISSRIRTRDVIR
jgi:IclR family pca regulon transcriptional regulator